MKTDVDVYAGSWGLHALLRGTATAATLRHKQLPCGTWHVSLRHTLQKHPKTGQDKVVCQGKVDSLFKPQPCFTYFTCGSFSYILLLVVSENNHQSSCELRALHPNSKCFKEERLKCLWKNIGRIELHYKLSLKTNTIISRYYHAVFHSICTFLL